MAPPSVHVVLHDEIADAVRREASRTGKTDAEVVEAAVRRLVAVSVLDRLWERSTISEGDAMTIATEEINALRAERRAG